MKAKTKNTLLANHGIDRNWTEGKSEVQLHHAPNGNSIVDRAQIPDSLMSTV